MAGLSVSASMFDNLPCLYAFLCLSHVFVYKKFQKIRERKSKPPARCCFMIFFGGNRGEYSTRPGYCTIFTPPPLVIVCRLYKPLKQFYPAAAPMPLYGFIYGACGAVRCYGATFHYLTIITLYAALYGIQHIYAGYTQTANIIPPKRIISHLAPICPAAHAFSSTVLYAFICACVISLTVAGCKPYPIIKYTIRLYMVHAHTRRLYAIR